jgi:two-component system chemotaxis response regulator CheB
MVLTGMGNDGASGALEIRKAGGLVLAQDEASSVVWGMPGSALEAGAVHEVAPLERLAIVMAEWIRRREGA